VGKIFGKPVRISENGVRKTKVKLFKFSDIIEFDN
jgi:hypothetical protein